nr:MAG TPA_asm: hypothetical protein [Caudoviricetes sp.]
MEIEYVVFKKGPLKVAATFFTEQEALMYTLAISEQENKGFFVAQIIAQTEGSSMANWKLFKRDGSQIVIQQSFKQREFCSLEEMKK